jgi:hypothetical protein
MLLLLTSLWAQVNRSGPKTDPFGGGAGAGLGAGVWIMLTLYLGLIIVSLVGMWKVFEKAGQPGWAAIVPIYNLVVLFQITDKPLWWIILFFIPCIGSIAALVCTLLVSLELADRFGKGAGFGIGLWLLGFIFYPILGFGDAQYRGKSQPAY